MREIVLVTKLILKQKSDGMANKHNDVATIEYYERIEFEVRVSLLAQRYALMYRPKKYMRVSSLQNN